MLVQSKKGGPSATLLIMIMVLTENGPGSVAISFPYPSAGKNFFMCLCSGRVDLGKLSSTAIADIGNQLGRITLGLSLSLTSIRRAIMYPATSWVTYPNTQRLIPLIEACSAKSCATTMVSSITLTASGAFRNPTEKSSGVASTVICNRLQLTWSRGKRNIWAK